LVNMPTRNAISKIQGTVILVVLIAAVVAGGYYYQATRPAAPVAPPVKAFRIAFIESVPATSVWYLAHYHGITQVAKELNSTEKPITTSFFPDVPIPDEPALAQSLSDQGYDLIVSGSGILSWLLENNQKYPKTQYIIVTAKFEPRDNVGSLNIGIRAGYYAAGVVSAYASKTKTIGFVSAFNVALLAGLYNAYRLGAQSVNPDIKTLHVFANAWADPTVGASSVDGLLSGGADVIAATGDGMATGATIHARDKDIYAIGYLADMSKDLPDNVLASVLWDPYSSYRLIITAALAGGLRGTNWELQMSEGSTKVILNEPLLQKLLTPDQIKNVQDTIKGLESGDIYVPAVEVYPS